jgi:hypothetical protein
VARTDRRAISERFSVPRLASAAIVLLLHLIAIAALVKAGFDATPERQVSAQPIMLWLARLSPPNAQRRRHEDTQIPEPHLIAPEMPVATPDIRIEGADNPSEPSAGSLLGVGRYLNACSGGAYEKLSRQGLVSCLGDIHDVRAQLPLLGPAIPSPFDAVLAKRRAPVVPIEHPCPVSKPTSNLGIPCYFGQ